MDRAEYEGDSKWFALWRVQMTDDTVLLERVRDALRADLRIGFDDQSIVLSLSGGDLVIEGEVADVAVKRRALRKAAEVIEGRFIVDRLHVRPATPMEDGARRAHLPRHRRNRLASGSRRSAARLSLKPNQANGGRAV